MLDLTGFASPVFTDAYRRIVSGLTCVQEPEIEPYGSVHEDLIRCIWFGGHHKRILATEDGARVEVLSPGWWNAEAGPDFKHAEVLLEKRGLVKGDVEVHVLAKDWERHGHHKDPSYNSVVLHVFFRNDSPRRFTANAEHGQVPQLCLEKHLDTDLAELRETIPIEDVPDQSDGASGVCRKRIEECQVDDAWLGKLLDYAGDERMLAKARRFHSALQTQPFDQVLYEGIMEGLGYKSNSAPFLQLSRVCTLAYLQSRAQALGDETERAETIQAALFGVAHLLPDPGPAAYDEETQAYLGRLQQHWQPMQRDFARRIMDTDAWQFAGARPVNYPPRRISAVSRLLAQQATHGLGRQVLRCFEAGSGPSDGPARARSVLQAVDGLFATLSDPYWDFRCKFAGQRAAAPRRLVGKDRCLILVVNVLVPVLLQYAREHGDVGLEERVHAVLSYCRKLAPDSVVRSMERHLFGTGVRRSCVNSARRQQGLHQIYQDFCKRADSSCSQCVLLLAIDAAPASMRRSV